MAFRARPCWRNHRTSTIAATVLTAALALTACSTDSDSQSNGAHGGASSSVAAEQSQGQFPITITHAFGETVINEKPERIAAVGWANHEVPLALGITPVGITKATFGDDDDNGILPWVEEKLAELGADSGEQQPVLFDQTDGIPFEQVADTKPDVILAAYSGITQEDYDTLSKIAPVVAYPGVPWGASLAETIRLNATAMGMAEQGEELVTDLKAETEAALDRHPKLRDKKVLFTAFGHSDDMSKIGFYSVKDPRLGFLLDHGLDTADIVRRESEKSDSFHVEVSAEKPEDFADVDLIISYSLGSEAEDKKLLEGMQAHPLLSKIPAIAEGNIVFLEDGPGGAVANPSPLSIPWGIESYFAQLESAL